MNMLKLVTQVMRTLLIIFLLVLLPCLTVRAEQTITETQLCDKVRGLWLGELIGNAAGRETEGDYQTSPNPDPCVPWVIKQAWDADDDTDIEYIALHILETDGFDCNSVELAGQWLSHITSRAIYIANRQAWYLMGDGYLPPETGSRTYNEHWYSIDSQITTEVFGGVCPGMVQEAIDLTGKFARISNEGFPVHAAQLYAGMYAKAFFEPNVVTLVTGGLETIPSSSRTHKVVSDVLNWYQADAEDDELDWRATREKLYDHYHGVYDYGRYYNWVESTVNTGATILALLYGQGNFKETVQIGVLAGWDCDCNPATAGGLIGIIDGYSGLPADLTDPCICGDVYKNVFRLLLPDPCEPLPQEELISHIAVRITELAEQSILANGGYISYEPEKTYHIPDDGTIITEPEKPDPCGPCGLVAEAEAAGITVTPTAAVAYYISDYDRRNLNNIIDGITDNSYNGHKAYYSYVSDPGQRPERDWYQLNFSEPVKFEQLTFYEGDVAWNSINTYYKYDYTRGGFFVDLTVEILRDGIYIQPGNLVMTPGIERYQMYQAITFNFAPTAGDAIRVIGTAGGSQNFTTIMELEVQGDVDPCLYVAGAQIVDGEQQRSTVDYVGITFSRDVNIEPCDVELAGVRNGTIIQEDEIDFAYNNALHELTLQFDPDDDEIFDDSLPDDVYHLKLNCNTITDTSGNKLLDDDENPNDGYYTIVFHRLFGDTDGSGVVDETDMGCLSGVWQGPVGDSGLDDDGDGMVTMTDFACFAWIWLRDYR